MIISKEQVRRALDYLQREGRSSDLPGVEHGSVVTDDLVARVVAELAAAPETRMDRVAEGRTVAEGPIVSADLVAEKMIGRIISDSIR